MTKNEADLLFFARRALQGQTPRKLLGYSFVIEPENRLIRLRAHFDGEPSADEMEDIQVVETEIATDFVDTHVCRTEYEVVPAGARPNLLPGVAYERAPGPLPRR